MSETLPEYRIVTDAKLVSLMDRIESYLRSGWRLAGGVSTYESDGQIHFIQAVTRS